MDDAQSQNVEMNKPNSAQHEEAKNEPAPEFSTVNLFGNTTPKAMIHRRNKTKGKE